MCQVNLTTKTRFFLAREFGGILADSARPLAYGLFFGVFHVEETFCGDRAIIELKTTRIFQKAVLRPKMGGFFKFSNFCFDKDALRQ